MGSGLQIFTILCMLLSYTALSLYNTYEWKVEEIITIGIVPMMFMSKIKARQRAMGGNEKADSIWSKEAII